MQLGCSACKTTTPVPNHRLHLAHVCESCGRSVMALESAVQTDDSLPAFVTGTEMPVLLNFWAAWSGTNNAMASSFAEAAGLMPEVRFGSVDNNAAPGSAARYGIRSIPTLILLKRCIEIARFTGALSTEQLVAWVQVQLRPTTA